MKKWIMYGSGVLLIAVVVLLYYLNKKQETPGIFPLKRGSKGEAVKNLQIYLNNEMPDLEPLAVDGIFGTLTEARLYLIEGKYEVSELFYNKTIA